MTLTYEDALARLVVARTRGDSADALCPAHDDHDASLKVTKGEDGKLLLHCYAGCTFENIVAVLNGTAPDQAASSGHNGNGQKRKKRAEHHGPSTRHEFRYYDGTGHYCGKKVRIDYTDAEGKSHKEKPWWEEHDRGAQDMPLYNLRALLDRAYGSRTYLTEGELKCDRLNKALQDAGMDALCVATGTGAAGTPCDATLAALVDYDVALWPDNDEPGHQHMYRIAAWLVAKGERPRWVTWADAPDKGDVADFLMAGHTVAEIENLIGDVPPSPEGKNLPPEEETLQDDHQEQQEQQREQEKPPRQSRYRIMTDEELEAVEPARGILGDILFEDAIGYLYGESDTWKSFIALSWACSLAAGLDWLDREVLQGPVVYVAAEGARGLGPRIKAWKAHHGIKTSIDVLGVPMPVNLLDPSAMPALIADVNAHPRLKGRKPRAIVFDTLARSMDGGDENGTSEANQVTAAVGRLKAEFGCLVLIVHHQGKDGTRGMRGNSALKNNADIVIRVIAPPLEEGERRHPGDVVTLRSEKSKDSAEFEDVLVTTKLVEWPTNDEASDWANSLVVIAPTEEQVEARKAQRDRRQVKGSQLVALKALSAATGKLSSSDWLRASKLARRTFFTAIRMLVQVGAVECDPVDGKYVITEAGKEWAK